MMMKKNQLDIPLYVLFTKADRKIENLISKRNQDLYINQDTYQKNMPEIIDELEYIPCRNRNTSCPDQLAKALKIYRDYVLNKEE